MDYIREAFSALISVFMSISLPDIIDMAILSYLIYHGIKLIRETRATQLIKGIVIICVAYMIYFQNTTMKEMLKTLSNMDTRLTAIETHLDIDDKKAEKK